MSLVESTTGEKLEIRAIPLGLIDNGPAVRRELLDDAHAVALFENIDSLPRIQVRVIGDRYQLIDGRHRLAAHKFAKRDTITADVYDVDDRQALIMAVNANTTHGRGLSLDERRTNARSLLAVAPDLSNREVARICGLSHNTVGKLRPENEGGQNDHLELPGSDSPAQDTAGSSAIQAGAGAAPPAVSEFAGEGPGGDEPTPPSPAPSEVEQSPAAPSDDPAGAAIGDDAAGSSSGDTPAGSPLTAEDIRQRELVTIGKAIDRAGELFAEWLPEKVHELNDVETTKSVDYVLGVIERWRETYEATRPTGLRVINGGEA